MPKSRRPKLFSRTGVERAHPQTDGPQASRAGEQQMTPPPTAVEAGETGGSNVSDLTDENEGRTRMMRRERSSGSAGMPINRSRNTATGTRTGGNLEHIADNGSFVVPLGGDIRGVGGSTAGNATGRSARATAASANNNNDAADEVASKQDQPNLMDDDSSTDSAVQRQLSLGLAAASPEVALRRSGGLLERMPQDVSELIMRAQSQSGEGPPPMPQQIESGTSGAGGAGGVGANGAGRITLPPPPPLASALLRASSSRGGRGGDQRNVALRTAATTTSASGEPGESGVDQLAVAPPNRISSGSGGANVSFSTIGSSSGGPGNPNLLEGPVANPPTPTGSLNAQTRSRSLGVPAGAVQTLPPEVGSYRRNTTNDSSHARANVTAPLRPLSGRRSTSVTFTDPVASQEEERPPAPTSIPGNIDNMPQEERDRLLRQLLASQQQEQEQSISSQSGRRRLEPPRPALICPAIDGSQRSALMPAPSPLPDISAPNIQPGAVSVPIPARDPTENVVSANGDGSNLDPAIVEMIRRQEEAAIQLSLAETRRQDCNSNAAEAARAAVSESDEQLLNRALELSKKETSRQLSANEEEDNENELNRVLELSKNDVGGRSVQASVATEEDEEMKRALNISLQDTGGRQYILGGPRSSVYYSSTQTTATLRDLSLSERPAHKQQAPTKTTREATVRVSGAGIPEVNGLYILSGTCNSVNMYSQKVVWQGKDAMFTLYRCFLDPEAGVEDELGTPRLWFISIVPPDVKPGTDEDKDFYVARGIDSNNDVPTENPPENGWAPVEPYGIGPCPTCKWEPAPPGINNDGQTQISSGVTRTKYPEVQVYAAGSEQVNGVYKADETASVDTEVATYVNRKTWNGEALTFYLYRSYDDDDESEASLLKRWFLSIVPVGCHPGSSGDTDMYYADEKPGDERKIRGGRYILPPSEGWKAIRGFGVDPPPVCLPNEDDLLPDGDVAVRGNNHRTSSGTLSLEMVGSAPGTPGKSSNFKPRSHSPYLHVTDENNETHIRKVAMCIVCKTRKVTHVLVPCGHPCLCEKCADYQQLENMDWQCPIGRCRVERVMRFFGTLVEDDLPNG